MNGNSKVLASLRNDLQNFVGTKVIAVLDNDRIRRTLNLAETATDDAVRAAILADCNHEGVDIFIGLIKENAESILEAARDCEAQIDSELWESAISQKQLLARDIVFTKIATAASKGSFR